VNQSDTQKLTRGSLELSSREERRRQTATFVTVVVMLLLAGSGAFYLRDTGAAALTAPGTKATLAAENAALRAQLERLRTDLDVEKATRAELNRQAGELRAQIDDLTNRLEFLAARDGRVEPSR
jgi:hypothetical protein